MDQQGCRARRFGGIVARHARIVAIMGRGRALYHQREIVFADMMGGRLRGIQWPTILQPGDLQR